MDFENSKAIWLQIVDWICEKIARGQWRQDDRIPAVRETAALLQVNPNTAMRAYESMQADGIIYNKRGIGFFVAEGAREKIVEAERERFYSESLPELFTRMAMLGISADELAGRYQEYKLKNDGNEDKH